MDFCSPVKIKASDPINQLSLEDSVRGNLQTCASLHGDSFNAAINSMHPAALAQLKQALKMPWSFPLDAPTVPCWALHLSCFQLHKESKFFNHLWMTSDNNHRRIYCQQVMTVLSNYLIVIDSVEYKKSLPIFSIYFIIQWSSFLTHSLPLGHAPSSSMHAFLEGGWPFPYTKGYLNPFLAI